MGELFRARPRARGGGARDVGGRPRDAAAADAWRRGLVVTRWLAPDVTVA
jgi:hypothetical protein